MSLARRIKHAATVRDQKRRRWAKREAQRNGGSWGRLHMDGIDYGWAVFGGRTRPAPTPRKTIELTGYLEEYGRAELAAALLGKS